jgi:peptide subunit release factor RF-3
VKQVRQALQDSAEEGLVQVFRPCPAATGSSGVVGVLQLDVLKVARRRASMAPRSS